MRRLIYIVPVLVFLVVAGYFVAKLVHTSDTAFRDQSIPPSALIGRPAPTFDLAPLYDGAPRLASAADLGGKPVVINFFASWCVPCRGEQPLLMRLAKDGVAIHGIAYKDEPAAARRFLDEVGNPFGKIGLDREGRLAIDFGLTGVPETYVIDKDGKVRLRAGPINEALLENDILPLLKTLAQ
jgi:cytochrome c biogenesis protein CcmG/thiol:disulfide interchange protein DsbE